ncbi:HEAT repeat domain-containing protein [Streptomyces sp. NPDC056132]|uniref:HEAT repeat domain-containing protein n=1 Tax=Streptomyces sp. NPDC056132 TaxID=3345722 RepID=UPI0035DB1117
MTAPRPDLAERLVAALHAKDRTSVGVLLCQGADPNALAPDGLPVLCIAVAGFDHESADALTDAGADPAAALPDGTTPLLRAVDLGSPTLVGYLLDDNTVRRLSEAARGRLLDLARHWCETGAEDELRRRTGATGAAERRVVDEEYTSVEEVSLAGHTVRAGFLAVLTTLEERFAIATPMSELVARAAPHHLPDRMHANWSASYLALSERRGAQAWSELKTLRDHPDPVHRVLLADVVWSRALRAYWFRRRDTAHDAEFLFDWALDETDGMVLARLLEVYGEAQHPDQEAVGLLYADHPDPRVRRQIPGLFCRGLPQLYGPDLPPSDDIADALFALSRDPDAEVRYATAGELAAHFTPAFREALLVLVEDPDAGVRAGAAVALGSTKDRTPAVTDALVTLLDEDDLLLRLEIVHALARRDDPRTEEAWNRVGELPVGFDLVEDHRVLAYWDYQRRHWPAESP